MDRSTAHMLNRLNARFYEDNAQSFSSTRRSSWAGWERALDLLGLGQPPCSVLDLACGNLRFEAFLAQRYPTASFEATCIDSCPSLSGLLELPGSVQARFVEHDLVGLLLEGEELQLPPSELTVCFGFMHHVPGSELRQRLLQQIFLSAPPSSCVAVSFWQFLQEEGLARRAQESTAAAASELDLGEGALEEGDCLLGWQGKPGAWRYCHSFCTGEADELARKALRASGRRAELSYFEADGRNGRLNRYLLARMG